MRVLYKVRPYESEKGSANRLYEKWVSIAKENCRNGNKAEFRKNIYSIVNDFDNLPILNVKKPRVGLVGEILVKFHPTANNNIVETLEGEGVEAVMPDLMDFFLYCAEDTNFNHKYLGSSKKSRVVGNMIISYIEYLRRHVKTALKKSARFSIPHGIKQLAKWAEPIISLGNQTGEGWFLTAEMVELIQGGVPNIVCMQPFACLPNHVTGKGMIKELKRRYKDANIVAVDYDPGASEVNQLNRIKLMLSVAFKNLNKQQGICEAHECLDEAKHAQITNV